MFARFVRSFRAAVRKVTKLGGLLLPELPTTFLSGLAADLTRSRSALIAENVFLRQQLIVAMRGVRRPLWNGYV